ncbi:MAG: hypothetical protein ACO3A4_04670 [Silvanigrellaceae bacterium]
MNIFGHSLPRWCTSLMSFSALCFTSIQTVNADQLYWRRYSPGLIGPGPVFVSPVGNIWNGGWWMSVDLGRSPLSICRISDGPRWAYGNYFNGVCAYYSPTLSRGHDVSVGFDLLGGTRFPNWRTASRIDLMTDDTGVVIDLSLGDPTISQQQTVQSEELQLLCRIQQADGAFIGTLIEGGCYAAWNGQTMISADYEIIESQSH